MKNELSSYQKTKEAICESAFCYVYSSHIDEAFFTLLRLETRSWMDLRRDIWDHIGAYSEIENVVRSKRERSVLRNSEGLVSGNGRPVLSKEMSSIEYLREAFCTTLL